MFILDPVSNTLNNEEVHTQAQFRVKKHKYMLDVPIPDEAGVMPPPALPHDAKLKALFMGLIKQKHWIYFLNQDIQLRADHLPVLQVKLKEHHVQSECIERIITSGHCSAIVVENNQMTDIQLQRVHSLCSKHKVQLILLENLKDSDKLH